MEENRRQHLEFIQNSITRMSTNSFLIKGMSVTLLAAFVAVAVSVSSEKEMFIFVSIIPTILFWFLDSYYLQQERKFRGIYENIVGIKKNIDIQLYEMPLDKFKGGKYCFVNVFFSKTVFGFYGVISILLFLVGLLIRYKNYITINC